MPITNVKTTSKLTNPVINMVTLRSPKSNSYEVTLCVNTNIVKKAHEVQIHTKVASFVEHEP